MKAKDLLITTIIDNNIIPNSKLSNSKKEQHNNIFEVFDKIDTISLFLGLSTYEIFQGYQNGILYFIINTLNYSKGKQILNKSQLVSLLNKLLFC